MFLFTLLYSKIFGGIIFNYWRGTEKQIDIFAHPGKYLKPLSSNKTDLMENTVQEYGVTVTTKTKSPKHCSGNFSPQLA
jgi:hypothetical protein